jgi:hypothetical protein
VDAAAVAQITVQNVENLVEQACGPPLMVVAIAGLVRRVDRGEVIPGGAGGELPEDRIEDAARVVGGTAAGRGFGREERGEKLPLLGGEEHGIFENKEKFFETMRNEFLSSKPSGFEGHTGAEGRSRRSEGFKRTVYIIIISEQVFFCSLREDEFVREKSTTKHMTNVIKKNMTHVIALMTKQS